MTALIKLFLDICFFKANPQDIPASRFLATGAVILYAALSLLISIIELPPGNAILSAFTDTAILVALGGVSLWIIGKQERSSQTITALAGTGVILQLIAWPVLFWLSGFDDPNSGYLAFPRWGLLLLVLWNVMIIAHILRHALSVALPIAIGISVLYMYFTIRIASILFAAAG